MDQNKLALIEIKLTEVADKIDALIYKINEHEKMFEKIEKK